MSDNKRETTTFGNQIKIKKSNFRDSLYTKVLTSKYSTMKKDANLGKPIRKGIKEGESNHLIKLGKDSLA